MPVLPRHISSTPFTRDASPPPQTQVLPLVVVMVLPDLFRGLGRGGIQRSPISRAMP